MDQTRAAQERDIIPFCCCHNETCDMTYLRELTDEMAR